MPGSDPYALALFSGKAWDRQSELGRWRRLSDRTRQRISFPDARAADLVNLGNESLRAVAYFAVGMFTQTVDDVT
jgi:hypothetical protein